MKFYIALFTLLSIATIAIADPSKPVLPTQYEASCHFKLPYAKIDEVFFTWFDGVNGNQRTDYYGGVDQYFFLGSFNTTYEVVPTGATSTGCFTNTNVSVPITSIFPDLTNFVYVGTASINGIACYNWQYVSNNYGRTGTYNFYVSQATGLPVEYHMLGYDTLFGSHYDEYVLTYETIVPGVNTDAFAPPAEFCNSASTGHGQIFDSLHEMAMLHPDTDAHNAAQQQVDNMFDQFNNKYGRSHTDRAEKSQRRQTFYHNMRYINSHNRQRSSYKMGINHFADLTEAERVARNNKMRYSGSNNAPAVHQMTRKPSDFPPSFDWRPKGAVTPVKDQGVCGSCWSFATAQTIEGAYFVKHGTLPVLSEQALVDCSWPFNNNGCDGGLDFQAYQWIMSAGGLPLESTYPYTMADGRCSFDNSTAVVQVVSYVNITAYDQNALIDALLSAGPISVSMDAALTSLSFYTSGVYNDPQCASDPNSMDHAVLLVGYGTENGQDYWWIKNSWSTHYGDSGYMKIARANNLCGIATQPTYTVVA